MDLYISPLSGSLTSHVVLLEAGITPTLHVVSRATKRLDDGRDFLAIAPQGNVPVIGLPDGGILTETVAILQYVADHHASAQLVPAWGTLDRYRVIEWLNFTTSELHKKHLGVVFSRSATPQAKDHARENVRGPLAHVARHLGEREYLVGERFGIADIYMHWILFVAPHGGISLADFPSLRAYCDRISQRPTVRSALARELPLYAREAAAGDPGKSPTGGNVPVSVLGPQTAVA